MANEQPSNAKRLSDLVSSALKDTNPEYRAPEIDSDGPFNPVRHQLSGVTNGLSSFLQRNKIISDTAVGNTWVPRILGGGIGLGVGYLSDSLLANWFKKIPLIGNILSVGIGAVAGFITHQTLLPITTRTTDQSLPVGPDTVRPLPREKVIRDRVVPVPADDADHKPLPPVNHLVPEAIMENLRSPTGGWRQIMKLKAEVDTASTQTLGVGSVPPATKDQILLKDAREGVARLQISYQNWDETMRRLNDYTSDYTNVTRPAITQQLMGLGINYYDASFAIPRFPRIPKLQSPAEWNGWKGSDNVSGGLDAQGQRAIMFLREHVQGLGHLKESDWSKLNTSEKLNILRRYRAEASELAFTKLDGNKEQYITSVIRSLNWSGCDQYFTIPFVGNAAFEDAGANVAAYHDWLSNNTIDSPVKWGEFGSCIDGIISASPSAWKDEASRKKAKQVSAYAHFRARVNEEMDRFENEIHAPNRQTLEAFVRQGGELDQYNKEVEDFAQSMELLEKERVLVHIDQWKSISHKGADGKDVLTKEIEIVDVRNQPPKRYSVDLFNDQYTVRSDGMTVTIPASEIALNPFQQDTMKAKYAALVPLLEKVEQKKAETLKKPEIHATFTGYNTDEKGEPSAYMMLRDKIERETGAQRQGEFSKLYDQKEGRKKATNPMPEAEWDALIKPHDEKYNKPLIDYLKDNKVYNFYSFTDNRNNANRKIDIRERVYTDMQNGAKDFEVRINGGEWINVTTDKPEYLGVNPKYQIEALTRILEKAAPILKDKGLVSAAATPDKTSEPKPEEKPAVNTLFASLLGDMKIPAGLSAANQPELPSGPNPVPFFASAPNVTPQAMAA